MIKGTVTETHGERAKVRVNFKETTERGMRAYIDCWNPISAHPGDNVVIEYRKVDEKKAKWFQILLPVLCLAAGGIFGHALAGFFKMEFWLCGCLLLTTILRFSAGTRSVKKSSSP